MLSAKGSEVKPEEDQLGVPGMASGGASEESKGQAVAGSVGEEKDDPGLLASLRGYGTWGWALGGMGF